MGEETRYRTLFETMPQGVVYIDASEIVIFMNPAAENILGRKKEEIVGKSYRNTFWKPVAEDGSRLPGLEFPAQIAMETGADVRGMTVDIFNPEQQSHRWVSINAVPQFLPGSRKPYQVFITLLDVTAQTDLQAETECALKTQQTLSRTLQRALVPDKLSIGAGYRLADAYISGFEATEIGGDFYDVFKTKYGKVGIVVGDVCGKGLESVFLASSARSTIRSFGYETSSASESLTRANDVLISQEEERGEYGLFVTLIMLILDLPSGAISCANAGHPPAAIYRTNGAVEFIHYGDPPVGVMTDQQYKETEIKLEPGDKIVLYTDGVIEARKGEEMFEMEGIEKILHEHGKEPPDKLLSEMLAALFDWTGGARSDDVAIVIIERQP